MSNNLGLAEYLLARGIRLEPTAIDAKTDPILQNAELLQAAAETWQGKENIITQTIQARVNAIANRIQTDATPYEVTPLRDCLVEVAAIIDDFRRYAAEHDRRTKKKDAEEGAADEPEAPTTEIAPGDESAL